MCGFERSGEEYDAPNSPRHVFQSRRCSLCGSDPYEEHCVDCIEAVIEGLRTSEVSTYDLDVRREISLFRITHQRTYFRPARIQLTKDLATDIARRATDKDASHRSIIQVLLE